MTTYKLSLPPDDEKVFLDKELDRLKEIIGEDQISILVFPRWAEPWVPLPHLRVYTEDASHFFAGNEATARIRHWLEQGYV